LSWPRCFGAEETRRFKLDLCHDESVGAARRPRSEPISAGGDADETKLQSELPVVLEEYGDYQCPPCGLLYPELKKVEAEYGNRCRSSFITSL